MSKKKVLIVEDDKNISRLVKYNLEKSGYDCTSVLTGEESLKVLSEQQVDIIILDIMLPSMDGLEVCRQIKQDDKLKEIPIIMLTAKGEEVDRIVGFELGADDYVVKPFSVRELVLRVKSIMKRGVKKDKTPNIINIGSIKIDIPRHKITVGEEEVVLTAMEFKLLVILIERKGRVQSRERLLDDVWNIDSDIMTRTIDTHIKRLRQKLGKEGDLIETVRGIGYRFKENIE